MLVNSLRKSDLAVVVTGAGGSASANVIDSLNRASTKYFVVGADASSLKLHMSLAPEKYVIPLASDDNYVSGLNSLLSKTGCKVLHVQPDPEVRAVSRHRAQIKAHMFLPTDAAIQLAGDKGRFAATMQKAGVETPESVNFTDDESIGVYTDSLLERHERVWVRARVGAGARAALPVSRADQAQSWIRWWTQEKGLTANQFMASEMLPGREFAFQSVWQDGELVVGQARERVEYLYGFLSPSGQSSTPAVARTVSDSHVNQVAVSAIMALDSSPNGVYCVDIKTSAAGVPKVTEINAGRFFTTSNFFAAAGVNMPDMVMRAAMGERLAHIGLSPLEDNLYWVRMVDMGFHLVAEEEINKWNKI